MTRLAVENALGVVVHTQGIYDALSKTCNGPSSVPLCRYAAGPIKEVILKRRMIPCRLIVFGYIGRNRRLEAVLQALAELPEGRNFIWTFMGTSSMARSECDPQLRALDLKGRLRCLALLRKQSWTRPSLKRISRSTLPNHGRSVG